MLSIDEILASKEMEDVVLAINALRAKYSPTKRYEKDHIWPLAIARVGKYKPDLVLNILLDQEEYYPGYKEILAAGFSAWLIAPHSREVREALMTHSALEHMQRAEFIVDDNTDFTIQKDIISRYILIGSDFLIEVYNPLGGHGAFIDAPSFDEIWEAFGTVEKAIETAARALAYLHHAVDRFGRPGFQFVPSLNKAVTIFDDLKERNQDYPFKEKYVSRSLLHERWSQNKQTLALIYAASTIRVNRKTLLRIILDGLFSYDHHSKYLEIWVGRARYVAEHIFARMADVELERKTLRLLGKGKAIRFAPPKLDEKEDGSFNEIFRNLINR